MRRPLCRATSCCLAIELCFGNPDVPKDSSFTSKSQLHTTRGWIDVMDTYVILQATPPPLPFQERELPSHRLGVPNGLSNMSGRG